MSRPRDFLDVLPHLEAAVMSRKGKKHGDEITFQCPNGSAHKHGDNDPSADYNVIKRAWICRVCREHGNYYDLALRLGLITNGEHPDGYKETGRWQIGDSSHIRLEKPGQKKKVIWERNGKTGLDGLRTEDLPLYNGESLKDNPDSDVLLNEGERKTDGLVALGFVAVGTACGASVTPSRQSLEPLAKHPGRVFLCRDNDNPGIDHMGQIAARLKGMGKVPYIVNWPGVPEGGDASDFIKAGHDAMDIKGVLDAAPLYEGEAEIVGKPKDTESEKKETSFLAFDHVLYEQIVNGGQAAFIQYDCNTGETGTVRHVMQEEVKVIPLSSEEITLGAVRLPSGIAEYGDTLSLLKEIEAHICRYLDVSASFRKFAAYYILLSWLYDRFNTLPYLRFIGDTGCGKSRALDVCGGLCYKSTSASGCITPAPIYRMLKKWAGTIVLDEADLQNSDEYHEVTKILNCGFERNRPVIRAVKDNPDKLQILPTYGPKVFATRRRFKDAALEARCLTEIMQETSRDDIPATLTDAFYREQEALRNKLLLFRLRNYNHINLEDTTTLDLHGIEPRLRQISACFVALFAGQPDVLADYQVFIQHHQKELIEQRAATTIGQVVEKLTSLIESDTIDTIDTFDTLDTTFIPVSASDIAQPLNMTPQAVGQILKTLGLETKFIKAKSKRCIVYDRLKLDTLKRRYIPSEDDGVSLVSMVSTTRDSMQNDTDVKTDPLPKRYDTLDAQLVQKGFTFPWEVAI